MSRICVLKHKFVGYDVNVKVQEENAYITNDR